MTFLGHLRLKRFQVFDNQIFDIFWKSLEVRLTVLQTVHYLQSFPAFFRKMCWIGAKSNCDSFNLKLHTKETLFETMVNSNCTSCPLYELTGILEIRHSWYSKLFCKILNYLQFWIKTVIYDKKSFCISLISILHFQYFNISHFDDCKRLLQQITDKTLIVFLLISRSKHDFQEH